MDANEETTSQIQRVIDPKSYPASRLREIAAYRKKNIKDFLSLALTYAYHSMNHFKYLSSLDDFDLSYLREMGYVIVAQDGYFDVSF